MRDFAGLVNSECDNDLPGDIYALYVIGIDWHDFLYQTGIHYALAHEKIGAANLLLRADCG